MASKPPDFFYINLSSVVRLILNSKPPATKNTVELLNYIHMVKGFQFHSNHLPQLLDLKSKRNNNNNNNL